MPRALELGTELAVVINGAIENQREPEARVDQRLVRTVGEVDDGQAPVAEGERAVHVAAGVVGPARGEHRAHALHRRRVGRAGVEAQFTA